ncbi:ATP-binding protein [Bradyrhizobium diazoefficiens]|uniref:ATP-binding protein n=1 Tax=Bradyrhizobium diazoefficiens TaxID=1355477 RepID=UPI00351941E4
MLVLEDVFLADRESRRLFEALLPKLQELPVLVCVSYRPDFEHQWRQAPWFVERMIEPLHDGQMLRLARALLGDDPSVLGVMNELVARADGNPFFLEQLVITLIDDGSLEGTPGAYRLQRPLGELRVPGSIAAVIGARTDRLPEAAKSALEAAAVLGDPITRDLIATMQAVDIARAEELLALCVASGLLSCPEQTSLSLESQAFAFRHALVRDVVLGVLTRSRLKALHRQAFLALHAQPGAADADAAPVLAHHSFKGEEWEQAAKFAIKSMARAISHSANQEALQLFEKGIQAARRVDGAPTAQALELALRLEAIGAMMALGQIDDIFSNMERAEAIAVQLNDQRARAAVSTETAVFLWMRGRFEQGLRYASQGLEAARLAQRRHMTMAAHQTRLMHLHALGRYAEAAIEGNVLLSEYGPELSAHYVQPGWAAIPIINLYAFHASTLWRLGDSEAGSAFCAKAYEILSNIDHPYSRLLIDTVQSQMWIENDELDRAERMMRMDLQQCRTHNVPTMLSVCMGVLGSALARNGKAAEAVPMLERGFADRIYEAAGPYGRTFMRVSLGVAYRKLRRLDDAIAVGRKAVEQAAEEYGHQTEALYELAETLRHAGDQAGAEAHFKRVALAAERLGMPHYQRRAAAALADWRKDGHAA